MYPLGSGFAFHISCCHCHLKGVFNPFYEISQMFFIIEQTNPIMQSRYFVIRLKALRRLKFFLTHGVWGSSLCWNQWAMLISLCSTKNTFYTWIKRWDEFIQGQINFEDFLWGWGVFTILKEMSTRVRESNSTKTLKE